MKMSDKYHKWVEWSEEDQVYIGKCPDLITGIHGNDPQQVYSACPKSIFSNTGNSFSLFTDMKICEKVISCSLPLLITS